MGGCGREEEEGGEGEVEFDDEVGDFVDTVIPSSGQDCLVVYAVDQLPM